MIDIWVILLAAVSFCLGVGTALLLKLRLDGALSERIPDEWMPRIAKEPPPQRVPFLPRAPRLEVVEKKPPRERIIHWPLPPDVEVETPFEPPSRLPSIEWGRK